jgi:putative ABC transport system ATP-binding protein
MMSKQKEMIYDAPLIQLIDIHKIYQMGNVEVRANDGINLAIEEGEFIAIVGKSGSGKSTVMNIIGALDVPTSGQYILKGQDVSKLKGDALAEIRNRTIGFIFQQYNLLQKQTLIENVELPLLYAGLSKKRRRHAAMEALKRVGIEDKWRSYPSQLSGGQQQRGAIARALAGKPSLILADEPTGALDSKTSFELLNFLKELNEEGNTIILITHDRAVAEKANRIVTLHDGKILFDGNVDEYRKQVSI